MSSVQIFVYFWFVNQNWPEKVTFLMKLPNWVFVRPYLVELSAVYQSLECFSIEFCNVTTKFLTLTLLFLITLKSTNMIALI